MSNRNIEVFFSCSFSTADAVVNELVERVCKGLNLICTNVGAGFSAIPPEKARERIASAEGLIAVVTTRDRLDSGEYIMPAAVREEISIAYGLSKPILIVGEAGVRFDGFMNKSRRLNPLTKEQLPSKSTPAISIGGRAYQLRDGVLIGERVKKLHVHYSFPAEYGLRSEAVAPFVASYGYTLEYLAPWELSRVGAEIESFGKKLIVDLRITDPIPRYLYGIAWDPPAVQPQVGGHL